MRYFRPVSGPSSRNWRYWAGASAATCASTSAGPRPMPPKFVDRPRNWSRSRLTSSWPRATRPCRSCYRRPAPCRSCSRSPPGGNATGFMVFEFGMGGKFLELLKEIAPGVMRVAVLRDTTLASGAAQFGVIQAAASSLRMEVVPVNMPNAGEIEQSVETFARAPNGGLIVTASAATLRHRDLIIALAARHKLPAVYWERFFMAAGGLISYGPDLIDNYRRAAGYVDRILKGEETAEPPGAAPTKYETVINLKTAKALGLTVSSTLLARADEVIE